MSRQATEMALRYLDGLRAELRKQNTEKLRNFGKQASAQEPEEGGDNDDELSALLESEPGDLDTPKDEMAEGEPMEGDAADKLKRMLSKS